MNTSQLKCLSVFAVFAIIGFGPVSPGCLIGMYIVIKRPTWFQNLVSGVYDQPDPPNSVTAEDTRSARLKSFLSLLTLFLIDIAPVPVTPVIAFAIILIRPRWFYLLVSRVYGRLA